MFLRLGVTAFGGPAAHIAMMHEEVVRRRGWVSDERFVDLVGATNLIPGPNSTELAIHLGWDRARGRGLIVAGLCFIAPAALIVGALAWVYVAYGHTPAFEGVLYGIKPVVIAIVAHAMVKLIPTVAKTVLLGGIGAGALGAYLLGGNELLVLAAGGLLGASPVLWGLVGPRLSMWLPVWAVAPAAGDVELGRLFVVFLRIGAVLYGSGYVLLAFLRGELVERLGWITGDQLLDAISIGQVTPGPVFTTATFVGYLVAGGWGAVLATVGIFLPSFVFVALLTRLVGWMRASPTFGAALDGINAAAIGLMAGVGAQLAGDALVDLLTIVIFAAAGLALWRTRLNSAWLIAGGAGVGILHTLAT
ncbi:MAG TPA: chromate efflux transporter [Actinomycetota bacterium]|nr:chromate efflux transporter [Actinomycetota bacterium]